MSDFFRFTVIAFLVLIVTQLGVSLYYLWKGQGQSLRTAQWLRARITTAILLMLMLCWWTYAGWIQPHALPLWGQAKSGKSG